MKRSVFINRFDLDITLRDASVDLANSPEQRALAGLSIGMDVEDSYFATVELREAVEWVHEGVPGAKLKLLMILGNECDDYQRGLFYSQAGRGVVQMLDNLMWLEGLLKARGKIAGKLAKRRVATMPLVNPYVAKEPDGPIVKPDRDFKQGASWYLDPTLAE